MSGPACEFVRGPDNVGVYATDVAPYDKGYALEEDLCDVETLLVAASSMNPGDILDGCSGGSNPAGGSPNRCFVENFVESAAVPFGGGVVEYITHPDYTDGGAAYDGATCTGDPSAGDAGVVMTAQ